MPKISGVNHEKAVRALQKAGFVVVRQSGHIVMRRDQTILVIPRHNPIKPYTMGEIVEAAGLSVESFKNCLSNVAKSKATTSENQRTMRWREG